eukprot:1881926-Rhodomonas_salina.6
MSTDGGKRAIRTFGHGMPDFKPLSRSGTARCYLPTRAMRCAPVVLQGPDHAPIHAVHVSFPVGSLSDCYAMSGTALVYAATRCTEQMYGANVRGGRTGLTYTAYTAMLLHAMRTDRGQCVRRAALSARMVRPGGGGTRRVHWRRRQRATGQAPYSPTSPLCHAR